MDVTGGPGGIDDWLENLCRRWVVNDNAKLQYPEAGVPYRMSMNYDDLAPNVAPAQWASVLYGNEVANGWLQVGDRYLPLAAGGHQLVRKECMFSLARNTLHTSDACARTPHS